MKLFKGEKKTREINFHHFVFVEVPIEIVGPEVMQWVKASWWPKRSTLRFILVNDESLKIGAILKQQMKGLLPQTFGLEVTKFVHERLIELSFKKGMLKGYQVIKVEERANGTRIDYDMFYQVKGLISKFFWAFFYRKAYENSVKLILLSLKNYVNKLYQDQQERGLKKP